MIVFFKNFNRTERTILSIQSVRYLFPSIDIYCLNLFLNDENEYDQYKDIFDEFNVTTFFDKKKYNFDASGAGLETNGLYFTEGINKMYQISKEFDKVLMLDEDSFFTSGETIKFLLNNDFDLAYGTWPSPTFESREDNPVHINASIIAFNCKRLSEIFPIAERQEYIEELLEIEVYNKCKSLGFKTLFIPTRNYIDYGGDGLHTNDIEVIKNELSISNIPFKL